MEFTIIPTDKYIWNFNELNEFLINHQEQDITILTSQEGCCCQTIGLYDLLDLFTFKSVTIITPNPIEYHSKYKIEVDLPWKFLKVSKKIEPKFHSWNKNKIFGAIYGRPLWHRIGVVAHLSTYHKEVSLIGCQADPKDLDGRELFETNELFKIDINSFQNFGNILNCLPMQLEDIDTYTPGQQMTDGYVAQAKQVYKNFLIDIVGETFTSGRSFFVTEKTVRPILLKKPMIIVGPSNYLDYLHQLGFKTFADFWSEEYDGHDGRERYLRILQLIDDLSKKSKIELEQIYNEMQPILDYNYNLLHNQKFNTNITYIE